jgi:predicted nucleic acid-binding protein
MVAVDTNCLIAYLAGDTTPDIEFLDKLIARKLIVLPPVVIAELLSDPVLPVQAASLLASIPELAMTAGYWQRAGRLRARLASQRFKARLADTLVAQSCLDHKVPLLTRDKGFKRFVTVARLKLA